MPKPYEQSGRYIADYLVFIALIVGFLLQVFGQVSTQEFTALAAFLAASWSLSAKWTES